MARQIEGSLDRLATALRFVCGAIFGGLVGLWSVVGAQGLPEFVGGIVVGALLGGFLSARFGVRFWEAVRHLRWFVP